MLLLLRLKRLSAILSLRKFKKLIWVCLSKNISNLWTHDARLCLCERFLLNVMWLVHAWLCTCYVFYTDFPHGYNNSFPQTQSCGIYYNSIFLIIKCLLYDSSWNCILQKKAGRQLNLSLSRLVLEKSVLYMRNTWPKHQRHAQLDRATMKILFYRFIL